jgi:ABC-type antimicrobial peptide transport system permease subunit
MTEQQLISKLQELKQIKPRKEWVFSVKMQLLDNQHASRKPVIAQHTGFVSQIMNSLYQRKLAYSLVTFSFVVAGVFGFMFISNNIDNAQHVSADTAAQVAVKSSVEQLKVKSQNLAQAITGAKDESIPTAVKEVQDATNQLKDSLAKTPHVAKDVALAINNNNKAYLDVVSQPDVKKASEDLYKTIDDQMIKDLKSETLSDDQKRGLKAVEDLYDKGDYSDALVNILMIR